MANFVSGHTYIPHSYVMMNNYETLQQMLFGARMIQTFIPNYFNQINQLFLFLSLAAIQNASFRPRQYERLSGACYPRVYVVYYNYRPQATQQRSDRPSSERPEKKSAESKREELPAEPQMKRKNPISLADFQAALPLIQKSLPKNAQTPSINNYYSILGLPSKSDSSEVKKAYRKLALRLHPDKAQERGLSPAEIAAHERAFKVIKMAFDEIQFMKDLGLED